MNYKNKKLKDKCDVMRCIAPAELLTPTGEKLCNAHGKTFHKENPGVGLEEYEKEEGTEDSNTELVVRESLEEGQEALALVRELEVHDEASLHFAAEVISEAKGRFKALDAMEKSITAPILAGVNATRAMFKKPKELFKAIEDITKGKVGDYHIAAERARLAAMEAAQEAMEQGDDEGVEEALTNITTTAKVEGMGVQIGYTYEIIEEDLIPRQYMMPNPVALKEAARLFGKGEIVSVPGIVFTEKATVSSKSTFNR